MKRPLDRFDEYMPLMTQSLGHANRVESLRGYCTRLTLPVGRKSVEPMESLPQLVLADTGYGASTEFREQLTDIGFTYVVGMTGAVGLHTQAQVPLQAKELTMQSLSRRFLTVTWREGTNATLSSRFAAIRVHCASRAAQPSESAEQQWLLGEWPSEELEPTKTSSARRRLTRRSRKSYELQNCAGALSAIIRSSSRNSAWGTSRDAAGALSSSRDAVHCNDL